jgi:hypothetical protein
MRFYLDTSAYLAILLGEADGSKLAREVGRGQLLSSVLLVLEATRSLVRLSREGLFDAGELHRHLERVAADRRRFVLRDLTLDLCAGLVMPIVTTPRSFDLIHLRTALWFHEREPITRFVSLDEPLAGSAKELGLPVSRP